MNDTLQSAQQPDGPQHGPYTIPMPSRETTTNQQFHTVLSVMGALTPYLLLSQRELEGEASVRLDGGAQASAVTTFGSACDRLDAMLKDDARWTVKATDEVNEFVKEHFKGAAAVQQSQIQAVADMRRPSAIHKPRLTTIAGEFIALWGDPSLPGGLILGRGLTPDAALRDFDVAFTRRTDEQLKFAQHSEQTLKSMAEAAEALLVPEQPVEEPEARHKKRKTRKKY